jgi:RimJ/RimL family protein N-acetyltransferase
MPDDSAVPETSQPIIIFSGERVAMGPIHAGVIPQMVRWEHNIDSMIIAGDELTVLTPERLKATFTKFLEDDRKDRIFFAIYDRATHEAIGWCNLRDIDLFHETAELGILIGNPDFRGRGYGSEAVMLLVDYGFTAFGLSNIMLDTTAYNDRAINAYQKAGFKVIGRRRGSHRIGHRRYDQVFMDCLASEYYETHPSIFSLPESGLAE